MDQTIHRARSISIDRRRAMQLSAAGAAGLSFRAANAQAGATPVASPVADGDIPISGEAVPELVDFDAVMLATLPKWNLPGGQLAISREGRLVYNRGFGYASVEDDEVVEPEHVFRIASSSKPVTAVGILRLVDAGLLALDTPVFPLLNLEPPADAPRDPRLDTITVEQLLVHSGGWNSAAADNDPQYLPWPLVASHVLGAEVPAEAETIVRYMQSKPLDFDPGTQSAYSNLGYNILGRVIEHVSGKDYETFIRDEVLTPSGITTMAIGGTTLQERLDGEVRYYAPPGLEFRPSVFPGEGFVPVAYGSFYLRSLDAMGGWVGSAEDLTKFMLAIDGRRGEALLTDEIVTAMETTPRPPSAAAGAGNAATSLGLGWNSVAGDGGYEWSHAGALEGSNCSWYVRRPDGTTIAFLFNSLPEDYGTFFGETFSALREVLADITDWPDTDLFA